MDFGRASSTNAYKCLDGATIIFTLSSSRPSLCFLYGNSESTVSVPLSELHSESCPIAFKYQLISSRDGQFYVRPLEGRWKEVFDSMDPVRKNGVPHTRYGYEIAQDFSRLAFVMALRAHHDCLTDDKLSMSALQTVRVVRGAIRIEGVPREWDVKSYVKLTPTDAAKKPLVLSIYHRQGSVAALEVHPFNKCNWGDEATEVCITLEKRAHPILTPLHSLLSDPRHFDWHSIPHAMFAVQQVPSLYLIFLMKLKVRIKTLPHL